MLTASCHCGEVRVEIAALPDYIHECNCSLCAKTGARWGYSGPDQVSVTGATRGYARTDKPDPTAETRFCPGCGWTTHFVLTPSAVAKFGNTLKGVNLRLADESVLAGVELRYPDGRAWSGEGEVGYVREPRIIGA